MRRIASFLVIMLAAAFPARAQLVTPQPVPAAAPARQPQQQQQWPTRQMLSRDIAVLQVLDKVSARTTTLRVPVGSSAAFGLIVITVKSCQAAPPSDPPESAAFLEISEIDINSLPRSGGAVPAGATQSMRQLYSGWMFASSPALAALEHPIYDVTVISCDAKDAPPAPVVTPDAAPTTDTSQDEAPED